MTRTRLGELALLAASAGASLLAVELALRAQPAFVLQGEPPANARSERLHHRKGGDDGHAPESAHGRCGRGVPGLRVLLLGDSWAEEGSAAAALGRELSGRAGRCVRVSNAGNSSYSPSLYLLKARAAAQRARPDLVVALIDDTDLGDEWHRYRHQRVVRGGGLEAVAPGRARAAWAAGLLSAGGSRWHLARLLWNLDLSLRRWPSHRRYLSLYGEPWHIFSFHLSPRPREEFPAETRWFRARLDELAAGLAALTGSPGRVVLAHHPHYPGAAGGPGEPRYNGVVAALAEEAALAAGARFIGAGGRLEQVHGPAWRGAFRWPEDPFSHLTPAGYAAYGAFLGRELARDGALP